MNVCFVSLVTVRHGVKGGMEVHGQLLNEGLVRLGHGVTVVASRHPAGVEAETRDGVRLRYARAGQFGSQRGAWVEECTRLVMALHREAPIDVLCCQQAVAPPSLLRFARHRCVTFAVAQLRAMVLQADGDVVVLPVIGMRRAVGQRVKVRR